jgi:hypothetical protein
MRFSHNIRISFDLVFRRKEKRRTFRPITERKVLEAADIPLFLDWKSLSLWFGGSFCAVSNQRVRLWSVICQGFKLSKQEEEMRLILRYAAGFLFLICISPVVLAQGVLPRSYDAAATLGFNSKGGIDGSMHPSYGLSGAYNRWGNLAAVGEFEYQPFGSNPSYRQTIQLVGGGFRYYIKPSRHMVPYATATGGFARIATNQIGTGFNNSEKDGYFAVGGGASFYVAENWGIRPELRYRNEFVGLRYPIKEVQGSISLFYQFGGTEAKAKK